MAHGPYRFWAILENGNRTKPIALIPFNEMVSMANQVIGEVQEMERPESIQGDWAEVGHNDKS